MPWISSDGIAFHDNRRLVELVFTTLMPGGGSLGTKQNEKIKKGFLQEPIISNSLPFFMSRYSPSSSVVIYTRLSGPLPILLNPATVNSYTENFLRSYKTMSRVVVFNLVEFHSSKDSNKDGQHTDAVINMKLNARFHYLFSSNDISLRILAVFQDDFLQE